MEEEGIKLSILTAGFVGSVIALAMARNLNPFKALATVLAGSASATYLTPLVLNYFKLDMSMENPLAFILGLTGMNALAGLFKLSSNFAEAPIETVKSATKGRPDNK